MIARNAAEIATLANTLAQVGQSVAQNAADLGTQIVLQSQEIGKARADNGALANTLAQVGRTAAQSAADLGAQVVLQSQAIGEARAENTSLASSLSQVGRIVAKNSADLGAQLVLQSEALGKVRAEQAALADTVSQVGRFVAQCAGDLGAQIVHQGEAIGHARAEHALIYRGVTQIGQSVALARPATAAGLLGASFQHRRSRRSHPPVVWPAGVIPFALLTRGRTGSTSIAADIGLHPEIVCHQELFTTWPTQPPFWEVSTFDVFSQGRDGPALDEYVDYVIKESTAKSPKAIGWKILTQHLHEREDLGLFAFLLEHNFKMIHLTRDPVRSALSGSIAAARGLYSLRLDDPLFAKEVELKRPVHLDPHRIVQEAQLTAQRAVEWSEFLASSKLDYIPVTYEDYTRDRVQFVHTLVDFLGVEPTPMESPLFLKMTSDNVWDDVENRHEVADALRLAGLPIPE